MKVNFKTFLIIFAMIVHYQNVFGQSYTKKLQMGSAGGGTVTIYQDETLEKLVNGKSEPTSINPAQLPELKDVKIEDNIVVSDSATMSKTYKRSRATSGYRVQLYSGGDSRDSRMQAYTYGSKFKSLFPSIPVYTHFYSPHWICRVGDFRTHEEAAALLKQLRENEELQGASIVKCKIFIPL